MGAQVRTLPKPTDTGVLTGPLQSAALLEIRILFMWTSLQPGATCRALARGKSFNQFIVGLGEGALAAAPPHRH